MFVYRRRVLVTLHWIIAPLKIQPNIRLNLMDILIRRLTKSEPILRCPNNTINHIAQLLFLVLLYYYPVA